MIKQATDEPDSILKNYRVGEMPLYIIGNFDTGLTVYSQQIRALNLVWALVESELIKCQLAENGALTKPAIKIAIVGGGFAGISVATSLVIKQVNASITIFEERDTLLPLQQGSDSRWLHPRIYDWPTEGSDASVAMLPVLNWRAARASDVVVQILTEWKKVVAKHNPSLTLYCNARHLHIHSVAAKNKHLQIEWVGEKRDPSDATALKNVQISTIGASETFDVVILAVGFGLERGNTLSYWRNEIIGQPSLDHPRRTYLVSGQGDGAMIDLLRLRVSQYRQDRILGELFSDKSGLLSAIKDLHNKYSVAANGAGLFNALEKLSIHPNHLHQFNQVRDLLSRRLRRDTDVILQLKVRKLSELFNPGKTRISFQNKLLLYLLYKCGGFSPSCLEEKMLLQQHPIPPEQIIRRHGTLREEQLSRTMSNALFGAIKRRRNKDGPSALLQSDKVLWSGGYFGFPGSLRDAAALKDPIRGHWRKEYLPGPTALLATAFCGSLAGVLRSVHLEKGRLRITLLRAISIGNEELLQQTCDYLGTNDETGSESAAARTFPAYNATIGQAYKSRKIVRSLQNVKPKDLEAAMALLLLNAASRTMSREVSFVLAIPILEPEESLSFTEPNPVAGVIYIDSTTKGFFINDDELINLVSVVQQFLDGLEKTAVATFDYIRNVPLAGLGSRVPPAVGLPDEVKNALELVNSVAPPKTSKPFQFNFDYSDFVPI